MTDRGRQTLPLSFNVNGSRYDIEVEPHELLLDVIRKRLGLTGSKRSCDVQVCGACTVLLNGRPVSSCTLPAFEARDKDVLTIEGMAKDGKLHPIQEAFIEYGGFQCGFCTPGMILTAKTLLDENPNPDGRRGHRVHERQHLPLHRLQEDRRVHHGGGEGRRGRPLILCRLRGFQTHGRGKGRCQKTPALLFADECRSD